MDHRREPVSPPEARSGEEDNACQEFILPVAEKADTTSVRYLSQRFGHKTSSIRADTLCSNFQQDYIRYQYQFVQFFVEHMGDLGRAFGGDFAEMMTLAIVGQVFLKASRAAHIAGEDPYALPDERVTINASRIADVTGIPRETVRRKLEKLEKRGWVARSSAGGWRIVVSGGMTAARRDLAEIDRRGMARVARLVADLERLAPPVTPVAEAVRPANGGAEVRRGAPSSGALQRGRPACQGPSPPDEEADAPQPAGATL